MKKTILFLFIFTMMAFAEQTCQTLFEQGVQAYQEDDFKEALQKWESCSDKNAEIFYHLGNVNYQLDRWGMAILNFEKALRLEPSLEDARFNLKLAESKKIDTQETLELEQKEVRWLWNAYNALALNQIGKLLTGLLALGILGALFLKTKKKILHSMGYSLFIGAIILMVPLSVVAGWKAWVFEKEIYGICLGNGVPLLSEMQMNSKAIREINEGTKVELLSESEDWLLVKLSAEVQGFVRRSDLGLIR